MSVILALDAQQQRRHISPFTSHHQYKMQCISLAPAWMVFTSGGMKVAWAIYEQPLIKSHYSTLGSIHLTISWFIGVIIGAIFATTFVQRLSKNVAHYASGSLVLVGGALFVFLPSNCIAILFGRYLDGTAFGIIFLQAIFTGGEVSSRSFRGTIMTTERIFFWAGISTQMCYSMYAFDKTNERNIIILTDDQIHGAMSMFLGLMALICNTRSSIESPVYLQLNHREPESLTALMQLYNRGQPSTEIYDIFNDNRLWIGENISQSVKDEIHKGVVAFMKLSFLRSLVTLNFTFPFHWVYGFTTVVGVHSNFCMVAYGVVGLLGSIAAIFLMDYLGRRITSCFALFACGTLLLALGGMFLELEINSELAMRMKIISIFLLTYQLINACGFAPVTTIYLSEAFALPLKVWFLSGVIVVENLVQVIVCVVASTVTVDFAVFFFVVGVFHCLGCLIIIFLLPETKGLTLRQCNHAFSKASNK